MVFQGGNGGSPTAFYLQPMTGLRKGRRYPHAPFRRLADTGRKVPGKVPSVRFPSAPDSVWTCAGPGAERGGTDDLWKTYLCPAGC